MRATWMTITAFLLLSSCGSTEPSDAGIVIDVDSTDSVTDTFNVEECLLGPTPPTTRECCEYTGDRWLEAAGLCVIEP